MSEDVPFHAIARKEVLDQYLDTLRCLVQEAIIHFEADGLRSDVVDPAKVASVFQHLDASAFESYHASGGKIGFSLERLQDYIGAAEDDDALVELELNAETRKIHIETGASSFKMAGIDPDSVRPEPDKPDLDLLADVTLPGAAFDRGVKSSQLVAGKKGHVEIVGYPSGDPAPVRFETDGDKDEGAVGFENSLGEDSHVGEGPDGGSYKSIYSLDYLNDLKGPIPSDAEVRLRFGEEFPARLSYEYDDGRGDVEMLLAPRIKTN